jgi:hypothetical protein
MRHNFQVIKRQVMRFTVCKVVGHYSTGTLLWWVCDRCYADFANQVRSSRYVGPIKITRS